MNVGDIIIRKKDTMVSEINGWKKIDTIIAIDGIMYTLKSGNVFPKPVLEALYSSIDEEFEIVKPNDTTSQ